MTFRPPPQPPPYSDGLPFVFVVLIAVFILAMAGLGFLFADLLPGILGGR